MSATADAKGIKRICLECGIRFYDLNKTPITCPSCAAEFTGEEKPKPRKSKAAAKKAPDPVKQESSPAADKSEEDTANTLEEGDSDLDDSDDIDVDDDDIGDLDEVLEEDKEEEGDKKDA